MIDTEAPSAPELLKECSQGQTGVGFPFLAVLDASGKLVVGQKTDPLEEGDHHDPKKVKEFLTRWVAEPKDAQSLLNDALTRTSSDDIPYAAMSETSSNCWKFSVINEASCWEYLVDKPSRTSWMAA
jgi:hypothetical protein